MTDADGAGFAFEPSREQAGMLARTRVCIRCTRTADDVIGRILLRDAATCCRCRRPARKLNVIDARPLPHESPHDRTMPHAGRGAVFGGLR